MLHQLDLLVLGVQDSQLRVDALVRAVQVDTLLEQVHQLGEVAADLVLPDKVVQVVHEHDDVDAAHLRQAELVLVDARVAHVLPRLDRVGLARRFHRLLACRLRLVTFVLTGS